MQRLRFGFSAEGSEACSEDVPQQQLLFSIEALLPALQYCIQELVAETSSSRTATLVKVLDRLSGET